MATRHTTCAFCLGMSIVGCHRQVKSEEITTSSSSENESETEELQVPLLIEPASGSTSIQANQWGELSLQVSGITLGNTLVLLNDRPLGTLSEENDIGLLTSDRLTLYLRGAFVRSEHRLTLLTSAKNEHLRSNEVLLRVEPASQPSFSASLSPPVLASGQELLSVGIEDRSLLLLVNHKDVNVPQLRLLPQWDPKQAISVELPQYKPASSSFLRPGIAGIVYPDAQHGVEEIRVVWRIDWPGTALAYANIRRNEDSYIVDPPQTILQSPDPLTETFEWATYEGLFFLENALIIEMLVAQDSELPHPGDHRLVSMYWPAYADHPASAQWIAEAERKDIDSLGPVLNLRTIHHEQETNLAARIQGHQPARLQTRQQAGPYLEQGLKQRNLAIGIDQPISTATIFSSFDDWTTATLSSKGQISLCLQSSGNEQVTEEAQLLGTVVVPPEDLPLSLPTNGLSPGLIAGYPIFLIPYGMESEVFLVGSTGLAVFTQPIKNLFCDSIVFPASVRGNEDRQLAFACLQAGDLRLGTLYDEQNN